ncbi:hypothetical protein KW794_00070 [Candidatus Saccharibacteria bacterium]|nr:hypothetical protein [Candidatus Saccharibacteria bacterium]
MKRFSEADSPLIDLDRTIEDRATPSDDLLDRTLVNSKADTVEYAGEIAAKYSSISEIKDQLELMTSFDKEAKRPETKMAVMAYNLAALIKSGQLIDKARTEIDSIRRVIHGTE